MADDETPPNDGTSSNDEPDHEEQDSQLSTLLGFGVALGAMLGVTVYALTGGVLWIAIGPSAGIFLGLFLSFIPWQVKRTNRDDPSEG